MYHYVFTSKPNPSQFLRAPSFSFLSLLSFHSKEEIEACNADFEYVLLSPVFGSISKKGYEGKGFDVTDLDTTVIGMGGINVDTIQQTFDLGFKGVGVLGGIWNTDDSLVSFQMIYNVHQDVVITQQ